MAGPQDKDIIVYHAGLGRWVSIDVDNATVAIAAATYKLGVKDGGIGATQLADNIDASGKGFNADLLDGYHAADIKTYVILDDTDDIAAAINSASDGTYFWLNPGTYTVTTQIKPTADVVIKGAINAYLDNQTGTYLFYCGQNRTLTFDGFTLKSSDGQGGVFVDDNSTVRIMNMEFVGYTNTSGAGYAIGLSGYGITNVSLGVMCSRFSGDWSNAVGGNGANSDCIFVFDRCCFDGVQAYPYYGDNFRFSNCKFQDAYVRFYANATASGIIMSCIFLGNPASIPIQVSGDTLVHGNYVLPDSTYTGRTTLITGDDNVVIGNHVESYDDGIYVSGGQSVVMGNYVAVKGSSGRGIQAYSGEHTIVGNRVYQPSTGTSTESMIEVGSLCGPCVVANNILDGTDLPASVTSKTAVYVAAEAARVNGNTILNGDGTAGYFAYGIRCATTAYSTAISANTVNNVYGVGIQCGEDTSLTSNTIVCNGSSAVGIQVCTGTSAVSNVVRGTCDIGIRSTADEFIVTNNIVNVTGKAMDVDITLSPANTIIKNNRLIGTVASVLPTDGVNGNIVYDNIGV